MWDLLYIFQKGISIREKILLMTQKQELKNNSPAKWFLKNSPTKM